MVESVKWEEKFENKKQEIDGYKEITSKLGEVFNVDEARKFFDNLFSKEIDANKLSKPESVEYDLHEIIRDYFKDLKEKSEVPYTIPENPFNSSDLKKLSPEENAKRREEFYDIKAQLKMNWEKINGMSWPKYDHDVYSASGNLIRKNGSDYDAHHIQPLGMNGKNEARNITPLNAEVHYDRQGVHGVSSPYSKMDYMLGGIEK